MNTKNENTLLDLAADILKCKNDVALAIALDVAPPVISKVRHGRLPVGATLIIKLHEATGMPVANIKAYITHGPQQVPEIRSCNACDWAGTRDATVTLGAVGPLCPECRETTTVEVAK